MLWFIAQSLLISELSKSTTAPPNRLNVLLIVLDDWRPEANAYGRPFVHTPHIDSIAAAGTTFTRAYVQAPQCCPTRNSFLTSRRPDHTRVFTNGDLKAPAPAAARHTYFRQAMPGGDSVFTLPQWFKHHNYTTTGGGKVFHPGTGLGGGDAEENGISWSTDDYYYCTC